MAQFSSGGGKSVDTVHVPTWQEKFFGTKVLFLLTVITALEIPVLLLLEKFLQPDKRASLWRLFGHRNTVIFVKLAKIDLDVRDMPMQDDGPLIYASTHPSMMDGLIMFSLIGPDAVTLVAPYSSFSWPGNYFFSKMGFIDIQRDVDDKIKHPTANTKEEAFKKVFAALDSGLSLLIFPEGHVEREHKLHYIHTGVSRISIRTNTPIQVGTIIGLDNLLFAKNAFRPGTVTVRFGTQIDPPSVSKYVPFRKVVKYHTKDIERAIVNLLPLKYLPDFYNVEPTKIAAFFDIDNTLYNGYSMKDFMSYLWKRKSVSRWIPIRIAWWLMLEKFHLLSHNKLMDLSAGIIGGFKAKEFEKLCTQFFNAQAKKKINHHVLPTLKDHIKQGHHVILVSEVVHPLARLFAQHVEATSSIDTVLHKDSSGVYSGKVDLLNYGYTKAERVEAFAKQFHVDLRKSYAYTDSSTDLPLLYAVRHKVVVNPDRKLQKLAAKYNWPEL